MSTVSRVIIVLLGFWVSSVNAAAATPAILIFGDSLSAGYGLPVGTGWVTLLDDRLKTEGYAFRVINASISGETTAGGLARLPRALTVHAPAVVVLELAANDGLRALPIAESRANLVQMVKLCQQAGSRVLLLGVRLPPNYGVRYTTGFEQMYLEVARAQRIAVVPWFMKDIADHPELMQNDGLHPNLQGQRPLLDNVWPALAPLLGRKQAKAA